MPEDETTDGAGRPATPEAADAERRKADLLRYLQRGRDALVAKLDGLGEYDRRRPLVGTGTNLAGLVKHTASVEAWYLGDVFGRPFGEPLPWLADDAEPNADMWADPTQTTAGVLALYRRVWAHSDATVAALPLDAVGEVWWWPLERRRVTLDRVLVHMIAETHRHAGHADLVRELIDGSVGHSGPGDNLPDQDEAWWSAYRARLEDTARAAGGIA